MGQTSGNEVNVGINSKMPFSEPKDLKQVLHLNTTPKA